MKLATLRDGTRDGRLVVVSRDGLRVGVGDPYRTLQSALDDWGTAQFRLRETAAALDAGAITGLPLDVDKLAAPLPRAYEWVDGSAYLNHVRLVRKARGAEPPPTLETDPLVYQGGSSDMLGPRDPFVLRDPAWGLDYESEIGVVLGDVPIGARAADIDHHVALLVLINDWTLRDLVPVELAKGFGFFQSKPATALAPFAITPDELGGAWQSGRAHVRVRSTYNGDVIGDCDAGPEMHFSFGDLIQHVARTRAFCAGTILGSGTVSNADRARGVSCLAERRMIEIIAGGTPLTPFMKVGDAIRIEAFVGADESSPFGAIDERVVASASRSGEPAGEDRKRAQQ
jgi:fumarylacetoacetate (FAA) hydrolase